MAIADLGGSKPTLMLRCPPKFGAVLIHLSHINAADPTTSMHLTRLGRDEKTAKFRRPWPNAPERGRYDLGRRTSLEYALPSSSPMTSSGRLKTSMWLPTLYGGDYQSLYAGSQLNHDHGFT